MSECWCCGCPDAENGCWCHQACDNPPQHDTSTEEPSPEEG